MRSYSLRCVNRYCSLLSLHLIKKPFFLQLLHVLIAHTFHKQRLLAGNNGKLFKTLDKSKSQFVT